MNKDACTVPAKEMLMHEMHANRTDPNATDADNAYADADKL